MVCHEKWIDCSAMDTVCPMTAQQLTADGALPLVSIAGSQRIQTLFLNISNILQTALTILGAITFIEVFQASAWKFRAG